MYLLVVGDGPDSENIARAASELGVSDRVKLLGHVTERQKFSALSITDLFVSTSQHEGFGLVYLEAMAYGLPIVCYDHGGRVDFLSTPATGAVIKLNDTEIVRQRGAGSVRLAGTASGRQPPQPAGHRNLFH